MNIVCVGKLFKNYMYVYTDTSTTIGTFILGILKEYRLVLIQADCVCNTNLLQGSVYYTNHIRI